MYNEQLAKETLIEGAGYIQRLLEAIDRMVGDFLAGRENLALKDFVNVVDGFEWLLNVMELTKPTQESFGVLFEEISDFTGVMKEMVSAFENNDYVLLGDLLNYEAKPILEQWSQKLQFIKDRLSGQ